MSGLEVIGAISAVIGIIDACVKIYDGAQKDLKLSETFRVVARRLPLLADTLTTCKTSLEPRKSSIAPDVSKALEDTLESCEERARNLRTIFEKVITTETDGWHERYVKVARRLGKGNKVEELMESITKDVQLVVNHRAVQSAPTEQRQQLEQVLQEVQHLESSIDDGEKSGTNVTNWYGKQNVNTGDGQQFVYESMSGTQNFNLVIIPKLDFQFTKPIGLCLDWAPHIDSSLFVGRAADIRYIHQALRPDNGVREQGLVVLGGIGGIGKTQLAIAYAKAKAADYDSIFWINATSEATVKNSLQSITERIVGTQDLQNVTHERIVAGTKQWLSDTKNTQWLLIFDNYDEPNSYDLRTYFPQTSHGAVIITTRLPDQVGSDSLIVRSINDIEESLDILQKRSKRANVKKDPHARRLAERLAGLPLALVTAGAFLHKDKSTWTFERYLFEYEKRWNVDPRGRLQLYEYQDRTLYTTWNLSYERLQKDDADAAEMLKLLAYFGHQSVWYELFHTGRRDDLPPWLLTVTGDSFEFEGLMRILVDYGLVEVQSGTQLYGMHTCVHDWTLAGLNVPIESWRYWYAFDCVAQSITDADWDALGHLSYTRYVPHAVRLIHSKFDGAAVDEIEEDQVSGAEYIAQFLQKQVQLHAAGLMLQWVLTWKQKALGRDHSSTLDTVDNLGSLYAGQGKLEEAEQMYVRALAGYEKALGRDHTSTLNTVNNLGLVYRDQGKLKEAEQMFLRALAGMEKALGRDHSSTFRTVNNLGLLFVDRGKLEEAEQMYGRALAGYEKALGRDHSSTLDTVTNLGVLYADRGKLDAAEQMYVRALAGYEKALGRDHSSTQHGQQSWQPVS